MDETLLDSRQVARLLNVSRSYTYFLIRAGELPAVRFGRAVRVFPSDVREYLRQRALRSLRNDVIHEHASNLR